MEIISNERENVVILQVSGEIDLYNAPEIKNQIRGLIDMNKTNVVINLGKVSYIDSSGIGALISGLSALKKVGGGLKIANVYGAVKKVFELTKLTSFFDLCESEDVAVSRFASGA